MGELEPAVRASLSFAGFFTYGKGRGWRGRGVGSTVRSDSARGEPADLRCSLRGLKRSPTRIGLRGRGLVCSAFTSSQLVAAVSGWALAFLLWDFSWANNFVSEGVAGALESIALHPRYGSFSEGIVSLANLVYFAGVALVGFAIARFSFDLRRIGF